AGDVLVRLDGRISAAQASAARAQVEIARAQRDSARSDCDRSEALFKGGGVSISQHQRTLAGCATADAQLAAAEAQARLAQSNLADTQIRAPFDGVVAERMVSAGEYVGPASPVVRLISTGAMRLELTVPAQSAGTVNSSRIAPVEMSRTTGEAGPTYSPALTIRSATTPSKGARIWVSARLLCARRAWASAAASWASAVAHPASVR